MAKNKKEKKEKFEVKGVEGLDKVLKTLGIIIIILMVFYGVTVLVTKFFKSDKEGKDDDNIIAYIQYDEILAGETFNMNDDEYYVLFYDFDGPKAPLYNYLISKYGEKENNISLYKVNLSNGFNTPYIGENSNSKVKRANDLLINGPTLIKIIAGKNKLYKEGFDNIKEVLE